MALKEGFGPLLRYLSTLGNSFLRRAAAFAQRSGNPFARFTKKKKVSSQSKFLSMK